MSLNEVSEMRVRALELAIKYDPTAPAIAICAIAEAYWKFIVGYEEEWKPNRCVLDNEERDNSMKKQDWYRVSFDLGIPQGTEFPKEWYEFFQWLVDGTKPFKTIGSLVIVPGLTTRGPVILDESADEMGG